MPYGGHQGNRLPHEHQVTGYPPEVLTNAPSWLRILALLGMGISLVRPDLSRAHLIMSGGAINLPIMVFVLLGLAAPAVAIAASQPFRGPLKGLLDLQGLWLTAWCCASFGLATRGVASTDWGVPLMGCLPVLVGFLWKSPHRWTIVGTCVLGLVAGSALTTVVDPTLRSLSIASLELRTDPFLGGLGHAGMWAMALVGAGSGIHRFNQTHARDALVGVAVMGVLGLILGASALVPLHFSLAPAGGLPWMVVITMGLAALAWTVTTEGGLLKGVAVVMLVLWMLWPDDSVLGGPFSSRSAVWIHALGLWLLGVGLPLAAGWTCWLGANHLSVPLWIKRWVRWGSPGLAGLVALMGATAAFGDPQLAAVTGLGNADGAISVVAMLVWLLPTVVITSALVWTREP